MTCATVSGVDVGRGGGVRWAGVLNEAAMSKPIRTVWEDLYDDPAKAAILRVRSELMIGLTDHIKARKWSKAAAAKRCGVTVPRIADLLRGSLSRFTTDDLVAMLAAAGLAFDVQVTSARNPKNPKSQKPKILKAR
jgi:predicted XRE-type DNA-binding protein